MQLPVVNPDLQTQPWYSDGLHFTCSQCGNCCTGGPGYVWISREEIIRLAQYLKITPQETVEQYCRKIEGKFSLKESRRGNFYDCIFLKEKKPASSHQGQIVQTQRYCSIYPVRPLQCRTWPFWKENLTSPQRWDNSSRKCHGMNHGRKFSLHQIEALRDATDWPQSPPTSK